MNLDKFIDDVTHVLTRAGLRMTCSMPRFGSEQKMRRRMLTDHRA
jgi:hypothetical protein